MEELSDHTEKQESRRSMLRKVGRFVLPTLVTFKVATLKAQASDPFGPTPGSPTFSRS
jgi:hypothetical protein